MSTLKQLRTAALAALAVGASTCYAAVAFIGEGAIPGTARDQSRLSGVLEDGVTPGDLVGGFGSAIAYTGVGNLYIATPDRGPADGTTKYIDRIYTIRVDVRPASDGTYTVQPTLVDTKLMRKDAKSYFTGFAAAFDETGSPESLWLDPEGVRVSACGSTAYVSDEYGPYIYEFDLASGKRLRSIDVPNKFLIDYPSDTAADELARNIAGRQANRGMEGLAISPDGSTLTGIMQSPLIQDGGLDAALKRIGVNNRMLQVDVNSGNARELVYVMDSKSNGVSEILAVNDHEFLVLERDGNGGTAAAFKKIYLVDTTGATDVRGIKSLPSSGVPANITPVTKKKVFIDLLDPRFGLAGASFPEKMEGLAFGPDLPDGRHVLVVTNDNDFNQAQPNRFMVFAFAEADLPGYTPQQFSVRGGPRCARGDAPD